MPFYKFKVRAFQKNALLQIQTFIKFQAFIYKYQKSYAKMRRKTHKKDENERF